MSGRGKGGKAKAKARSRTSEAYLVGLFEDTNLCAIHAKGHTAGQKDSGGESLIQQANFIFLDEFLEKMVFLKTTTNTRDYISPTRIHTIWSVQISPLQFKFNASLMQKTFKCRQLEYVKILI